MQTAIQVQLSNLCHQYELAICNISDS